MADDDTDPSESGDSEEPEKPTEEVAPESAPDTKEEPTAKGVAESAERTKSFVDELNQLETERKERENSMRIELQPQIDALQKQIDAPLPSPPTPQRVPPPPPLTESQKGNAATAIMQLLSLGTTVAIAYGVTAHRGSIVSKAALAGAINGWVKGNEQQNENLKRASTESLKLWELNRKFINEENRDQNTRFNELMKQRQLSLKEKLDLFHERAKFYQNYKVSDAAQRQHLLDVQKALSQQEKLQRDKEAADLKHRPTIYDVIGKRKWAQDYPVWVLEKSTADGHPIKLSAKSDAEEFYQAEKQGYTWSRYVTEKAEEEQATELKKLQQKHTEEERQREEEEPKVLERKRKEAKAAVLGRRQGEAEPLLPTDPNAPVSPEEQKRFRDSILGPESEEETPSE